MAGRGGVLPLPPPSPRRGGEGRGSDSQLFIGHNITTTLQELILLHSPLQNSGCPGAGSRDCATAAATAGCACAASAASPAWSTGEVTPSPAAVVTRTLDRNAEALNKSGLLCCVLGCFFPCVPALLLRNEARDKYNIEVRPLVEAFSVIKYVSIYATCTRAAPAGTWGRRCAARCACSARWGWRYRTSSREPRHSQHSAHLISTIAVSVQYIQFV